MTVLDYLTRCGGQLDPTTGVITGLPTATALGLTVRDWFAGQALAGLLASAESGDFAERAYALADDLLAERAKLVG